MRLHPVLEELDRERRLAGSESSDRGVPDPA